MKFLTVFILIVSALFLSACSTVDRQQDTPVVSPYDKRIALVIGNSEYAYLDKLDSVDERKQKIHVPHLDAKKITDALQRSGFEVHYLLDANLIQMRESVDKLVKKVKKESESKDNKITTVFYFAGHGARSPIGVDQYFLPIYYPAKSFYIKEEEGTKTVTTLDKLAFSLKHDLTDKLGEIKSNNLVIVDACSDEMAIDNKIDDSKIISENVSKERKVSSRTFIFSGDEEAVKNEQAKTKNNSGGVDPSTDNTVILYAANKGLTAANGEESSPVAATFLKWVKERISAMDMIAAIDKEVKSGIDAATKKDDNKAGKPYMVGSPSIFSDFYFTEYYPACGGWC